MLRTSRHDVERALALASLLCAALLGGCKRGESSPATAGTAAASASGSVIEAADDEAAADAGAQRRATASRAGEKISIAAGSFLAGSVPGDRGRDPVLERAPFRVELGSFEIDRLPFPNDPTEAPRFGLDRAQAEQACAERSGRLCTELEWERACKGPEDQPYAGALRWDPACAAAPHTCASGFGVLGLGAAVREWTGSDVGPVKQLVPQGAAVRGARADAADVDHRCARRSAVAPDTRADDISFRCCYGPRNEPTIASPEWQEAYQPLELPPEELGRMLQSIPKLAALSHDVKYFREDSALATVERRAERARSIKGIEPSDDDEPSAAEDDDEVKRAKLTTAPLLWSPVPGEELVVAVGRSGDDSFIVAFHRFPAEGGGHRYRVGSAMRMAKDPGPFVLGYLPEVRRRMHWLSCRGCYGESGRITYRDDNRVVITQH